MHPHNTIIIQLVTFGKTAAQSSNGIFCWCRKYMWCGAPGIFMLKCGDVLIGVTEGDYSKHQNIIQILQSCYNAPLPINRWWNEIPPTPSYYRTQIGLPHIHRYQPTVHYIKFKPELVHPQVTNNSESHHWKWQCSSHSASNVCIQWLSIESGHYGDAAYVHVLGHDIDALSIIHILQIWVA